MNQKFTKRFFIVSVLFLVALGSFSYGLAVGAYGIWPFHFISRMKDAIVSIYQTETISPINQVVVAPPHASRERMKFYQDLNLHGFLAIMGYDYQTARYVVWLLDEKGFVQHVWPLNYDLIDPDGPTHGSDAPHGLSVTRDGHIIVNFEMGDAMARLDTCGRPLWIKEGIYHHQIEPSPDDTFWTWQADYHPFSQFQYLIKVDSKTGKTIEKISLKDDIILKSPHNALVFSIPPDFEFRYSEEKNPMALEQDIFHPNDVEELTQEMAVHFPQFSPGDLLISLRHLHLIAVVDRQSKNIKWARNGPWRFQHDPDFIEDGTISVYDNNKRHDRSKIILVDPSTQKVWYKFPFTDFKFYNSSMGTHQRLPGGGELLTISEEGRVVILNPEGQLIFEFNNIISKKTNGHIQNAVWMPGDFFHVSPACNQEIGS